MRGLLPLLPSLALLTAATAAHADIERIAFVDAEPHLISAVETALESWSIAVVDVPAPPGGITVVTAPDVAREQAAGAVVWISTSTSSHAMIWVFDSRASRIVAQRIIAVPPFDEPAAAGVALTLKTLLRHSAVAPEPERYDAQPLGSLPVLPPPVSPPPARIVVAVPRESRVLGAAFLGLRWLRTGSTQVEPRLGLSLEWTPIGARVRLGPLAGFHVGPGISVDELDFAGHFNDLVGFIGGRARVPLTPELVLIGSLTGVGHVTSLDGRVPSVGQQVSDGRFNLGLAAGGGLEARLGPRLRLGLTGEVERQTRRQRYTVFGAPVLEVPGFLFNLGIAFAVIL